MHKIFLIFYMILQQHIIKKQMFIVCLYLLYEILFFFIFINMFYIFIYIYMYIVFFVF